MERSSSLLYVGMGWMNGMDGWDGWIGWMDGMDGMVIIGPR